MKITFEGKTFSDIFDQMQDLLRENINQSMSAKINTTALPSSAKAQGPGPDTVPKAIVPVDKAVETTVNKPVDARIAKMQAAKAAKKAARDAEAVAAVEAKLNAPVEEPEASPFEEAVDPVEVVKIRQRTIEDLQAAYANGRQKEVFVLLDLHGNGAKSFRELPPEAFLPIRKAIDNGALEGAKN